MAMAVQPRAETQLEAQAAYTVELQEEVSTPPEVVQGYKYVIRSGEDQSIVGLIGIYHQAQRRQLMIEGRALEPSEDGRAHQTGRLRLAFEREHEINDDERTRIVNNVAGLMLDLSEG